MAGKGTVVAGRAKAKIATGNDLLAGDVVYFTSSRTWSRDIREAEVADGESSVEGLLTRAAGFPDEIVGVYLADVLVDGVGQAVPAHFREEFRLKGPSNRPEHGRVAGAKRV